METMNTTKMPTPEQQPALYDDYDYPATAQPTGIETPDRIQKLIDQRKDQAAAPAAPAAPVPAPAAPAPAPAKPNSKNV